MAENVKQSVIITAIGVDVRAKLQTTWDEDGRWFERGKEMFGKVERQASRAMNFNSVVHAQNFADEIGAAFINPVTGVLDVGAPCAGSYEGGFWCPRCKAKHPRDCITETAPIY